MHAERRFGQRAWLLRSTDSILPCLELLTDEFLHISFWIRTFSGLCSRFQVILEIPEPGRLVHNKFPHAVFEAQPPFFLHILQCPHDDRQVMLVQRRRAVSLINAAVVLLLSNSGLLAKLCRTDADLGAFCRSHRHTLQALLRYILSLRTARTISGRELGVSSDLVLTVSLKELDVRKHPLRRLPVLRQHALKCSSNVRFDLIRYLQRLLAAIPEVDQDGVHCCMHGAALQAWRRHQLTGKIDEALTVLALELRTKSKHLRDSLKELLRRL
mmetsp:Transcript_9193/g.20351  ORF Transcript_9193/g.20351 Transcript_9193/m.20351 type:complete len:271 (-) Transcript_9193:156-968(-)